MGFNSGFKGLMSAMTMAKRLYLLWYK